MVTVKPIYKPFLGAIAGPTTAAGALPWQPTSEGAPVDWTPADITGVAEWWRADLGVTAVSTAVAAWQGQIAGETVVQGVSAARPTLTTRDSQSVLSFDGGDFLRGSFGTLGLLSQPLSWVIVMESTVATTRVYVDGDDATNRTMVWQDTDSLALFAGTVQTSATSASGEGQTALVAEFSGASSKLYSSDFTSAILSANAGATGVDAATIGANYASLFPMVGYIWEVVLVDQAITAGDLAALGAYLAARYAGLSLTY